MEECMLEDYEGNELQIGDRVQILNIEDIKNEVPGLLKIGDTFIVAGGNENNIVYVVREDGGETYGLFGERFQKIFEELLSGM